MITLLQAAIKQDYVFCALFILIGFITSFFNKNMIVILVIAMTFSVIVQSVLREDQIVPYEGFQEGSAEDKEDKVKESAVSGKLSVDSEQKGCTMAGSSKLDLINNMKKDAVELMSVQNQIISGFQTIEPSMDRAEKLIDSIQSTAQNIQDLKDKNAFK
jgi:hypothetical protein